jgi:hypothetical protein
MSKKHIKLKKEREREREERECFYGTMPKKKRKQR